MKTLLSLLVVLLLASMPLSAQKPVQDLPELQEWYSWSGAKGSYISYLPGFSANGGMNAITQKRDGDPTWFNRFAFDTTNQFSWNGGSWNVVQLDLNGDGIADYLDGEGRVYRGIEKNKPPVLVDGVIYERGGDQPNIGDFNGDGYDDVLTARIQGQTFRIIFGGSDLLHLHSTVVTMPQSQLTLWTGISAYVSEEGKGRFISYRRSDFSEGFYLYELKFEATPNDSVAVSLKQLSVIEENKGDKNKNIFYPTLSGLYFNKATNEKTFLIAFLSSPTVQNLKIYSIMADKFTLFTTKNIETGPLFFLRGSIDSDSIPDIATAVVNNGVPRISIFSGSPLLDFEPRGVLGVGSGKCDFASSVFYIGDVTGDGIGDIAIGESYGGCFSIYKGIDWRKLSVETVAEKAEFTLMQTEPNPIGKGGTAVLPATLAHTGTYTLEVFDLTGKRIGEVFKGELPTGEVRIPFDVKALNIPSGMFTLRLSDGKHTQERAFVINR